MRSLSVGAVLYVIVVAFALLWGPLSETAVAQTGITIGFSVDGSGLVSSSELGEEVGRYLKKRLSMPVKVRSFAAEDQLYSWLTRFHEVDFAWLSSGFLDHVSSGELYLLAKNVDSSPEHLRGEIVSRQGTNDVLRQQIQTAFLTMHESADGQELLARLKTRRFVSPTLWQTSAWKQKKTTDRSTGRSAIAEKEARVAAEGAIASSQEDGPGAAVSETKIGVPEGATGTEPLVSALPLQEGAEVEAPGLSSVPSVPKTPAPVSDVLDPDLQVVTAETPNRVESPEKTGEEVSTSAQKEVAALATPSPETGHEDSVSLVADYLAYNSEEESYEAKGDVVLRRSGVELTSEELLWQATTQDVAAQGAVQLSEAGSEVSGERMQYNMSTGQGQINEGRVFVREGNFHLSGAVVEKHGPSDYFVREGSFTTCDGEIPDWKFSAREVDVTLGGYAKAKDVWFHVSDVPILYTPYLTFPVKAERESGFLMPSFGYSNNKGALASLAWYQVIDRHLDATIYLDYLSEIGLGKGLEYRYALEKQNNGKAIYYHVTGLSNNPDLYYLEWQHHGELPARWQLTADTAYVNKKLFFEEFGETAEDYDRDKLVSTLMLRRNWHRLNLVSYARYIKDLEQDNDETLQRLPELGLSLVRYRLGETPLYLGFESYATNFWRREGPDGERLYLKPSFSAVFTPGSWLEIVPEFSIYGQLYNADAEDDEQLTSEFSLTLATRLLKTFDVDLWGIDRLQHSIEPKAVYTYVSDASEDDLPLFDLLDRIDDKNEISYSLVNRLTARTTAIDGSRAYREVFNLRLSQSYDIDEARNNRSGMDRPFSDVRVEMSTRPTRNFSLNLDSLVPVYGNSGFRTLTIDSSLNDGSGNAASIGYTYKDQEFGYVATDYATVRLATSLLKPVYVSFEERYDFKKHRELEKVVGLEYRSKCWSVMLTYRDRYRENDDNDQEVVFTFTLAGIGLTQGFGSSSRSILQ